VLFLLIQIVDGFLSLYGLILLIRALLSWFPNIDRENVLVRFIYQITDPLIEPIRKVLPTTGMLDFSVLVAMLIVFALQQVLRILAYR
jgi:YggT family protein